MARKPNEPLNAVFFQFAFLFADDNVLAQANKNQYADNNQQKNG